MRTELMKILCESCKFITHGAFFQGWDAAIYIPESIHLLLFPHVLVFVVVFSLSTS